MGFEYLKPFTSPESIPKDIAAKLLLMRDAYIRDDYEEVYHILYSIACPEFDELEPWKHLENIICTKPPPIF